MYSSKFFHTVAVCAFFLLLALYFFHPIPLQGTNVDVGHHLLLGKITVENASVPQTNLISFTHPEYIFVNNQWLSEVVFYGIQSRLGFNGLIVLSELLIISTFLCVFFPVLKKGIVFPAALVGFVYLQMMLDRTEIKPELFSFLLLGIFLLILYSYREKYTKWLFILPFLEVLWINFHIFFIVGIAVIWMFLIEFLLIRKDTVSSKKGFSLLAISFFTVLASLINPNFITGAIYPFHVLNNYGYEVIENLNILSAMVKSYADITFIYFLFSVCLLWLGILIFHKKMLVIDILLSVLFTFLGCFAVRNFPLFAIGTFIPMVHVFTYFMEFIQKKYKLKTLNSFEVISTVLVLILISPAIIKNFQLHGVGLGTIDTADKSIQFFQKNNLHGPIFNNYNIGNYLEYRLYPKEKIFVDGNPEQYPKEFFENVYYPMEGSFAAFTRLSNKYHINTIYYEHKNQTQTINPVLTSLAKSNEWKMVYLDSRIVLFVRNSPINKNIITTHEITEKNVTITRDDMSNKDNVGDLSNFFRVVGWYIPMMYMDIRYLDFVPNNCVSLRHIAAVMTQQNNPLKTMYLSKYQTTCYNM